MVKRKSIWSAIFAGYEVLNDNVNYRRLNFIDVRNRDGVLVEKNFFIDETEELRIGNVNKGEIVSFLTADEKLENVIKFYPSREEIYFEKKRYALGLEMMEKKVSDKLREKRKNERIK
jgi:hypothetical protein